jgi:hypothetical protein
MQDLKLSDCYRKTLEDTHIGNDFLNRIPGAQKQIQLHQIKNLQIKENNDQNEEIIHRMQENHFKLFTEQRINIQNT